MNHKQSESPQSRLFNLFFNHCHDARTRFTIPGSTGLPQSYHSGNEAGWHGEAMAPSAKLRLKNFLIFFSFTVKRNAPFSFTGKIFF